MSGSVIKGVLTPLVTLDTSKIPLLFASIQFSDVSAIPSPFESTSAK
ncbi:hypothetical protein EHE19_008995 [Ruminiclostridium herbifermentans]|uniref:Uncharacterized protein n=1 Tax=Ruminiclostridium herbifermentans TaxID=2488810 RepID=A0A7H1VT03_9FIRM|nr:hypothetical protein EHE19_008995 [Ruminiclostridium herbifermentans]